jgi:hypothetical protein
MSWFEIKNLGYKVERFGCNVWDSGFRSSGLGFRI